MSPATLSRIHRRSARLPVKGAIDCRPGDRKQLGQIANRVVAAVVQATRLLLLPVRELRLLPPRLPLGPRHRHALAGPHFDEVGLKRGKGRPDVEERLAHRIGRIVDARSDLELLPPTG